MEIYIVWMRRILMGKKIVISFPGGRGYKIPVLYFGVKYYADQGYEKLFICHSKYETRRRA